ncbi:F-box/LRR-repeat protein 5 [Liparis tanakae]|uniref:F-box/LRR-repeat protein 5 n=1 Tax=Liparis tanakae TaxID=230148 RepID=A0A4Z2E4G5_9TELE|nr:F-box/LRR-repeat protein 5 [Liparis tanakae]
MHERIENECIIGLLQQRCCTVYNVHSDNKLSEMLSLFEKGLHNVKVNVIYTYIPFSLGSLRNVLIL